HEQTGESITTFNATMSSLATEYLADNPRAYLLERVRSMRKPKYNTVTEHVTAMVDLADLITHIPENNQPLSEEDLSHYIVRSMPLTWATKWEESGQYAGTISEVRRYFSKLEKMANEMKPREVHTTRTFNHRQKLNKEKQHNAPPTESRNKSTDKQTRGAVKKGSKWCSLHKTNSHSNNESYAQKQSTEENNFIADDASEESADCFHVYTPQNDGQSIGSEITCSFTRHDGSLEITQALVDTGASLSVVDRKLVDGLTVPSKKSFLTANGHMNSNYKATLQITLPQFTKHRTFEWTFHAVDRLHMPMILGRDVLEALGIIVDFKAMTMRWDEIEIAMKNNSQAIMSTESLPDIDAALPNTLTVSQRLLASKLLTEYGDLFNGLGMMNGDAYHIPMKPNSTP
ncbi:unnamed protein product, partial [Aphanomyces euteiches]